MSRTPPARLRLPLLLALACAALASAHLACGRLWPWSIAGDGNTVTQQRDAGGAFDAVQSRGALAVTVRVGPPASVRVTVDRNLQRYVDVRAEGSTLVVEQRRALTPRGPASVEVTLPTLRAASASGSGELIIDGGSGGPLSLATSGSGGVKWRGHAERLEISTSGSGGALVAGGVGALRVATSGSGGVDAKRLAVSGDADVTTSGSGGVELTMGRGALRARTSGSGEVVYSGDPSAVDAQASGSGRVRRR